MSESADEQAKRESGGTEEVRTLTDLGKCYAGALRTISALRFLSVGDSRSLERAARLLHEDFPDALATLCIGGLDPFYCHEKTQICRGWIAAVNLRGVPENKAEVARRWAELKRIDPEYMENSRGECE